MLTQDDVIYMIVTDRFQDGDPNNNREIDLEHPRKRHGGDLLGIVQRLPYLKELGITAIWITPVYSNPPEGYHGYHPVDFEGVDASLCSPELGPEGSQDVVREFVRIVHDHGMKVVFDVVVNHTALEHPWLQERAEWFNEDGDHPHKWWVWGLPDLNHDQVDVNLYFIRNILDWVERTGVDALRIDAARHVETQFWHHLQVFVQGLHPNLTLIGEVWDGQPSEVAHYQAAVGFDSMFDYPLYHALTEVFAEDAPFTRLARAELGPGEPQGILNQDMEYRNAHHLVTFLDNHDTARFFHAAGGEADPEIALRRTRLALSFLFTTRGIPQLYYGDEIGMEGGEHPDNRRDMPWARIDEPPAGTRSGTRSVLARELFHFTQQLIRIRKESMALRYGLIFTLWVEPTVYAYVRLFLDDVRVVVLNNGDAEADLPLPILLNPKLPSLVRDFLPEGSTIVNELDPAERVSINHGHLRAIVPPRSAAIYRRA